MRFSLDSARRAVSKLRGRHKSNIRRQTEQYTHEGSILGQNSSALLALREYAAIKCPMYAFMIEAPWGAGKTHLVLEEFSTAIREGKARYVSLNGIRDRREFRRALLAGTSDGNLSDAAGTLGKIIGPMIKSNNLGIIVQDALEERLISKLPELLIFDDIERCEMSPGEILGIANDFIEHKQKNIVICGFLDRTNDDEAKKKRAVFAQLKEKVVGRTVRIVADSKAALPSIIAAMPDGQGKKWFEKNVELAIEVFDAVGQSNLRVLRQCIHDCGRVIAVFESDLIASQEAMTRFARTFLALAILVASGRLAIEQLDERANISNFAPPKDNTEPHLFYEMQHSYPKAEIFAGGHASIIPTDIGAMIVGVGYADPAFINTRLRSTGQFSGVSTIPLWRNFIDWRELSSSDATILHSQALSYVLRSEEIEPGPYLHLSHDLITIAKSNAGEAEALSQEIERRIFALAKDGKIPPAKYGSGIGWGIEHGFSFGGFAFDPDDLMMPLITAMRKSQIEAFELTRPTEAQRLINLLRSDPTQFAAETAWKSRQDSYCRTEILDCAPVDDFAEIVFDYIRSGEGEMIGSIVKSIAERHSGLGNFSREMAWAEAVKIKLIEKAAVASSLENARMEAFIASYWRFKVGE